MYFIPDTGSAFFLWASRQCKYGMEAGRWTSIQRCPWWSHMLQRSSCGPDQRGKSAFKYLKRFHRNTPTNSQQPFSPRWWGPWGSWPCVGAGREPVRHRRTRCHEESCAERARPQHAASACQVDPLHKQSGSPNPASICKTWRNMEHSTGLARAALWHHPWLIHKPCGHQLTG